MSEEKQLIPYEEFKNVSSSIPALLHKQRDILLKIQPYIDKLKVVDEESKAYAFTLRDQIKKRLEDGKKERMEFTRLLDLIKKEFTTVEAQYDNYIRLVDEILNSFAKKQLDEQRKKEQEAMAKLRQEEMAIELDSKIKMALKAKIEFCLDKIREQIGKITNAVTESNLEASVKKLSGQPKWTQNFEDAYFDVPVGFPAEAYTEKAKAMLEHFKNMYFEQASELMADGAKLLPIALKSKAEAQRLAAQDELRRAEEAKKEAEEESARVAGAKAIAHLDNPAPEEAAVKTKLKINITQNDGWLKIIAFWYQFDPEAKTGDLSRKTFAQCKLFAERKVNKDGTRIDHPGVEYVEDVKAKK